MGIEGKVALVTGGSRGIGAAVAVALAERGADIGLTYVTNADEVVARIRGLGREVLAVRADSGDVEAVETAVAKVAAEFGGIDVLVNNAGEFRIGPVEELTAADFDRLFAVNVRAPFVAVRAALPWLLDGGRVVTIGSNVASRAAFPGFSLYSASKAALLGMTKALGRELGPRGVTVNLVSPGPTDTDLSPDDDGPNARHIKSFTALGRYARPSEVAAAVVFLVSEGDYVTGAELLVDGGFTA
ncbi:3-oxoacyl-ACP reductase family protein [Actinosynnema sp. NPDC020468]|uniref:SDR family NAD(P)-dependent oxidoreductase n=1 Tax=Actinosynnema sp. NPDC020468 TaxID=3154488 RepID=UPI0033EAAC92